MVCFPQRDTAFSHPSNVWFDVALLLWWISEIITILYVQQRVTCLKARGTQDRRVEMPLSRNRQKSSLERKNPPSGYILHSQTGGLGLKHQHLQTQTAFSTRVQSTETWDFNGWCHQVTLLGFGWINSWIQELSLNIYTLVFKCEFCSTDWKLYQCQSVL